MKKRDAVGSRSDGSEPLLENWEDQAEASSVTEQSVFTPEVFIIVLTISATLSGFLHGYDLGSISGAILYIRDDFESVDSNVLLLETIVSSAILAAAFGAAIGGHVNDRLGRKQSVLLSDALVIAGALALAFSPNPYTLVVGRVLLGLGSGILSMTVPMYVAEAAPCDKRGALVTVEGLMISVGGVASSLVNYAFTTVPGTWRWMLGVIAAPAILQAAMFAFALPESPRWLASQGRSDEAIALLKKIHTSDVIPIEVEEILAAAEAQQKQQLCRASVLDLLRVKEFQVAATAGISRMVAQQAMGPAGVLVYSPTILQQAGFASNQTSLLLGSTISGVNVIGACMSILLIDRMGRRKLALCSIFGVMMALGLLSGTFYWAELYPPIVRQPHILYDLGLACPDISRRPRSETCLTCLASACGFCGDSMQVGACLVQNETASLVCVQSSRSWYDQGCPNNYGWWALAGLLLYMGSYSPGMAPLSAVVNSEIYPRRYVGVGAGAAFAVKWFLSFTVSQSTLSIFEYLGASSTFLLFLSISALAFAFVSIALPETKGLSLEQVEQMLQDIVHAGGLLGNWYRGGWYAVSEEIGRERKGGDDTEDHPS